MKIVKLRDFKDDHLDVIENDVDKDYGYSELYVSENTEDPDSVYACSVYKYRLPFNEKTGLF